MFSTHVAQSARFHLVLEGELDLAGAPAVDAELKRIDESKPELLVIDLRALTFMDSTGLGVLVEALRRATSAGYQLAVVRGPMAVQRVLEISKLDSALHLIADPSEVLTGST
jgi:anti-sigma B factor antagonist